MKPTSARQSYNHQRRKVLSLQPTTSLRMGRSHRGKLCTSATGTSTDTNNHHLQHHLLFGRNRYHSHHHHYHEKEQHNNNSKCSLAALPARGTGVSLNDDDCRHSRNCYRFNSRTFAFFQSVLLTSFLLLMFAACCIDRAQSLNCYTCSSADDPGCDESFSGRANITDTDCYKHIGQEAKLCRKIVQYIENKKVVIRSCGYIVENEDKEKKAMCYKRSGTFALMMESCVCYEDNCNHSASLVPNHFTILLSLLGSSIGLIYYSMRSTNNKLASN